MTDDPRNESDLPDDPDAPTQDDSPPENDAGEETSDTNGESAVSNGSSPPTARPRRQLSRSDDDRMIAGVASGLAEFYGISPVPVRIGFVVLSLFGGIGAPIYLLGWLVLPTTSQPSIISAAFSGSARGRGSRSRWRSIAAVVLIVLGLLFFLSDDLFRGLSGYRGLDWISWDAPFFALVLLLTGAALVMWPGRRRNGTRRAAPTLSDTHATEPTVQLFDDDGVAPSGRPDHGARTRARRRPSLVGTLCIAAMLIFFGTLAILQGSGVLEVEVALTLAGALAITGIGLAVSAFTKPARGLYFLGVVLAGLLLLTGGSRTSWSAWSASVGERDATLDQDGVAADAEETQILHGFGSLTVDLNDLPPHSTPHRLDIELAAGELRVLVPDDVSATIEADVSLGTVSYYSWNDAVLLGIVSGKPGIDEPKYVVHHGRTRLFHDAGLAVHRLIEQQAVSEPSATVALDIDVGWGTVEVLRTTAAATKGTDR